MCVAQIYYIWISCTMILHAHVSKPCLNHLTILCLCRSVLTSKILNISRKVPVQCISIVWFQKISLPTQTEVIEDFDRARGGGGGGAQKPKCLGQNWKFHSGFEGSNQKTILGEGMEIFWNHT